MADVNNYRKGNFRETCWKLLLLVLIAPVLPRPAGTGDSSEQLA